MVNVESGPNGGLAFSTIGAPGSELLCREEMVMLPLPPRSKTPLLPGPKRMGFGVLALSAPELFSRTVPALIVTPPVKLLFAPRISVAGSRFGQRAAAADGAVDAQVRAAASI